MFRVDEPARFGGSVLFTIKPNLPAASIGDSEVDATRPLDVNKTKHLLRITDSQSGTATAQTKAIHVCGSAATVLRVAAGCVTACSGDATISVDVRCNGTSILTTPIVLDSSVAAYTLVEGTLGTTSVVADSVLTVVVTVAQGTGTLGTGLFITVELAEESA